MTRYRVAIIGTGVIADTHMRALAEVGERVEAVAAVDVVPERVQAFCEKHALPRFYTDAGEMLEKEQPDLVLIATSPAPHFHLSRLSLLAGAHVLCEKPLCLSLAELDALTALEEQTSRSCCSVCQWRFGSAGQHFKHLIQAQALGRPLVGICQTTWFRTQRYYDVPWRGKWATEGGGPTMGLGIHAMDFFTWLLGEWAEVSAFTDTLDREIEVEDVSLALVRFKNRALGSIVNSELSPRQETYYRWDFQRATVELTALYRYTNENWRFTAQPADDAAVLASWQELTEDRMGSHTAQLSQMLDSLDRGARPLASTLDVRPTIELISALYKSAATRQVVPQGSILPGDPYYTHVAGKL